jgi:hypothetical protein
MQHSAHTHSQDAEPRSQDRRIALRHAHFEHIVVQSEWGDLGGALLDLSSTGGQVHIANGFLPFEGDEVTLQLVDAGHLCGHVAWVGDTSIGITFDQPVASIGDLIWPEQRGQEWYRRAVRPHS